MPSDNPKENIYERHHSLGRASHGAGHCLWHPDILAGAVNLLQGDSTAGKSYLSQAIIAALTTGRALPIAFTLEGGFRWIGEYNITLAGETSPRRNREREQAKQFLAELLADGPVDSEAVYALAEEQNIAPRTLERAKSEIGAKSHKPNGIWIWSMG